MAKNVEITKSDWDAYRTVQYIGHYNMLDPRARAEAGLSADKWSEILRNYNEYEAKFENSN